MGKKPFSNSPAEKSERPSTDKAKATGPKSIRETLARAGALLTAKFPSPPNAGPKQPGKKRASVAPPRKPTKAAMQRAIHSQSEADMTRLLHELEVHQIELEVQNDELLLTRDEAEDAWAKYLELYDFAPIGFLTLEKSSVIKMANLAGASLAGVERSQLVGRSFARHVAPPFRPRFQAFLKTVFRTSEKQSIDSELLVESGETKPVSIVAQRCPDNQKCRLTLVDNTKRKRAEDALRRNFALFANLFEQAPFGVFVVDANFLIQQVNHVAKPNFGDVRPLIGRDLREILGLLWSKRVADRIAGPFRHTLETGEQYISPGFYERRKDTKVSEVYEWQVQRLNLHDGEYGLVAFFNNVTDRHHAEKAQRRLEILTASNLKLREEITRRRTVEKSLLLAKREQTRLLKRSDRQGLQLRDLSHRILNAQELERKHISRELHDGVVQSLVGINLQLTVMGKGLGSDPQKLQQKIERTQKMVQNSMDIVHGFARQLRPALLDDLGLVPALQTFLRGYFEDTGIRVALTVFEGIERIENIERITLYRVIQEALANVARHAKASFADVSILSDGEVVHLEVTDNGKGFSVDANTLALKKGRLGLLGMRERVEMVGGTFSVHSIPKRSTTIKVKIPFPKTGPKTR